MNKTIFLLLLTLALSCGENKKLNQTTIDEEENTIILIGEANRSGLQQEMFKDWFTINYDNYKTDDSLIDYISTEIKDIQIKLFKVATLTVKSRLLLETGCIYCKVSLQNLTTGCLIKIAA